MISDYFEAPWFLERMRSGCVGPYSDGFASALAGAGYSPHTIRGYIPAAGHVGRWADRRGNDITSSDDEIITRFRRRLTHCKCNKRNKGVFGDATNGVELLFAHLREQRVIAPARPISLKPRFAAVSEQFADWLLRHRGIAARTAHRYKRLLRPFLAQLGAKSAKYSVESIRSFVIEQLGTSGRDETHSAVTAIRAFLRFLVAEGRVHSGMDRWVPTVPQWRLSSLPRYLETRDVEPTNSLQKVRKTPSYPHNASKPVQIIVKITDIALPKELPTPGDQAPPLAASTSSRDKHLLLYITRSV